MKDLKKWYLRAKYLLRVDILGTLTQLRQDWLSSKTVERTKLSLITVSSIRSEISRRSVRIGISSLMAMLKATYSAAVELKVMSVCSLLDQTMGQLKRVRENPVLDLTLTGS